MINDWQDNLLLTAAVIGLITSFVIVVLLVWGIRLSDLYRRRCTSLVEVSEVTGFPPSQLRIYAIDGSQPKAFAVS